MHSCSGTSMRHVPWIPLLRQRSRKVCVAVLYQMTPHIIMYLLLLMLPFIRLFSVRTVKWDGLTEIRAGYHIYLWPTILGAAGDL